MNDESSAYALDKRWIRRSFDRASTTYDTAAVLQGEVREHLLSRLDSTNCSPRVVIDAGTGTGHASRELKRRFPNATVIAVDFAFGMLRAAARQQSWRRRFLRLCADVERLPLADHSVDLILSNFMLPWSDPDVVFKELRRVLAPQGTLSFTTLGPDTLRELRAAWLGARPPYADAHTRVSLFIDMHDLGDSLVRAGFASPVLDVERYTLAYSDVRRLAADLKAVGARNATAGRPRGLTGPRKFAAMQAAYETYRTDGRLPATYEVVFGRAFAPAKSTPGPPPPIHVPLDEIKRQLRRRHGP